MQILHVNLANSLGGGEYQTLALMDGLRQMNVEQRLIHRSNAPLSRLAGEQGFDTLSATQALFRPRASCWRPPVVLHAHDGRGVHWARLAARLHRTPYLITRRILKAPSDRRRTHRAYAGACQIACVSQAVADGLHRYDTALQLNVVHDGLVGFASDEVRASALRNRHPERVIVAQIGRLVEEKNIELTLDIARRAAEKALPMHFWILGDGPLRHELAASASDLDNIELLGHRDDIGNYLAAADVLLHPARSEAFGSVIAEAMQHGVAVIASKVGGIPEVVENGRSGLLVDGGDVALYFEAIETLCRDPALRQRLAEAGRRRAARFSREVMTERYLTLYRRCLADRLAG